MKSTCESKNDINECMSYRGTRLQKVYDRIIIWYERKEDDVCKNRFKDYT